MRVGEARAVSASNGKQEGAAVGCSFIYLRKVGFWANDGIIEVWRYALLGALDTLVSPPDWVRAMGDIWREEGEISFTGGHFLSLDEHVTSPTRQARLEPVMNFRYH